MLGSSVALEARLAQTNREVAQRTNGGSVKPFGLIPDPCWNGKLDAFLMMRLGLSPFEEWNIVFLAADQRTAEILDVPPHPNGNIPAFVTAAEEFLRAAEARYLAAYQEADRNHKFARFAEEKDDITEKVRGLAKRFLNDLDEAWRRRPVS